MESLNNNLIALWQKFADKTAGKAELDALFEAIVSNRYDAESLDYMQEQLNRSKFSDIDRERWQPVLKKILEKKQAPVKKIYQVKIRWAAAILILASAGSYFLIQQLHRSPAQNLTQTARFKNDVAPGGNKAILTLGNGEQIILDSAHTGTIAVQGNAKILKTDSGKLTYSTTKEIQTAISYNVLTTPAGGQYQLTLSDGTQVWLNAASSIKYPTAFIGKKREVEITGEAYFEVKHDPTKPFHVLVNHIDVEDIGTQFNINAYTDESEMRTTLVEGSVLLTAGNENKQIRAGEQARVGNGSIIIKQNADILQATAWRQGRFYFYGTDLKTIMRQISRWYGITVDYGSEVPDHFTGIISRNANASQVLLMLEQTGRVHFNIEGKKVIVMK